MEQTGTQGGPTKPAMAAEFTPSMTKLRWIGFAQDDLAQSRPEAPQGGGGLGEPVDTD